MKKIIFIICLTGIISSCDYLDIVPDNVATIEYAFRDKVGAEKFLTTCYSYLPEFGSPGNDPAIMGSDEIWIHAEEPVYDARVGSFHINRIKFSLQNVSSPLFNCWEGGNAGRNYFMAIRDCNIFLESIGSVGKDLDEAERSRWIAEVKFLKAFYHYYLLKMYGPIPLIRENLPISAGTNEVQIFREPFDECIAYIVSLIDEAMNDLPLEINNVSSELGRITQPIALAIKAEALVTAASPLFNGNGAYAGVVDSRGTKLFNDIYDANKWKIAMEACKAAIDTAEAANHRLYEFNDLRYNVTSETKRLMSIRNAFGEKWNQEVIWGIPDLTTDQLQILSLPYFTTTDIQLMGSQPILSPSIEIAEMFYSENGVPINEDNSYAYANRYGYSKSTGQKYYISEGYETANLNQHREPRFYANLGFDGGIWYGNGRYKDIGQGTATETSWIVQCRQGNPSGKTQSIRYTATGYFPKKYTHFESATTSTGISYTRLAFPAIRLADLYLLYAEAKNEFSGPDTEIYHYLDLVRERAGLKGVVESWANYSNFPDKPSSKEGLREIIRQERMIELCFEGKKFWDVRRWKIADKLLNRKVKGWNVNGSTAIEYYNIINIESIQFQTKEYLWPLSQSAMRRNKNLLQNPFWEN